MHRLQVEQNSGVNFLTFTNETMYNCILSLNKKTLRKTQNDISEC